MDKYGVPPKSEGKTAGKPSEPKHMEATPKIAQAFKKGKGKSK